MGMCNTYLFWLSYLQVTNNGFFSIGVRYNSLSAFPTYKDYSFVAPFMAFMDIDTSSTGYVRYSECFTNSQLNDVSEHIRTKTGVSFYGIWMLVAEWNGVPLLHNSSVSTLHTSLIPRYPVFFCYIIMKKCNVKDQINKKFM